MGVYSPEELAHHRTHRVEIASYAGEENIALECIDCNEVLGDANRPGMNGPDGEELDRLYETFRSHLGHKARFSDSADPEVRCVKCDKPIFRIDDPDGPEDQTVVCVDVVLVARGRRAEIVKTKDSLEEWAGLIGRPVIGALTGSPERHLLLAESSEAEAPPNRIRLSDDHLIRGTFIVYRTHGGRNVDVTEQDLAWTERAFQPCAEPPPAVSLAELLRSKAAEVERLGFSTTPAAELQEMLGKVTRPHESTPADLTHARASAAAVGLSATIDRYKGLIVFRRLGDAEEPLNYTRIGGRVECEICGYEASDHPPALNAPFLTVMCDGRYVKL